MTPVPGTIPVPMSDASTVSKPDAGTVKPDAGTVPVPTGKPNAGNVPIPDASTKQMAVLCLIGYSVKKIFQPVFRNRIWIQECKIGQS
jgi:hypothetical protein